MADTWYRGEAVGVQQAPGRTNPHDFKDGMYVTDRLDVAQQYAVDRAPNDPGVRRVYSVPIDTSQMKVLNLNTDPRWQKYMQGPAPGSGLPTPETLIKQSNENYGRMFSQFIANNNINLDEYDAVLGKEYVRGGNQLCILNKSGQPSSLSGRLRLNFRPIGPTISTARPAGSFRFGGRIGPGLRSIGGGLATIGASMILDWIKNYFQQIIDADEIEDQLKDMGPKIDAQITSRIREVAELQIAGKQPFANVSVKIQKFITNERPDTGRDERESIPFVFLDSVGISDQKITSSRQQPSVQNIGYSIREVDCIISAPTGLSDQEVELYRAYRLELLWFEDQVKNAPSEEDFNRLQRERLLLLRRLGEALGEKAPGAAGGN